MGKSRVHFLEYSSGKTAYHTDHLGSSNVITDQDGNLQSRFEYLPYGKTSVDERPSNPESRSGDYRFTGKELDATGLYYYGARYYDPELGRFITPDSFVQNPFDPQTLNRYTYCRNNPLIYIDPSGNFFGIIIGAIIGALIGGAMAAATGGDIGKGFLTGAISGALFGAVGGMNLSGMMQTAAHTLAGSVSGAINAGIYGSNVWQGAIIGGLSAGGAHFLGSNVPFLKVVEGNGIGPYLSNLSRRAILGAAIGGGVSSAMGGNFWQGAKQGAITSAIAYTANEWLHGNLMRMAEKTIETIKEHWGRFIRHRAREGFGSITGSSVDAVYQTRRFLRDNREIQGEQDRYFDEVGRRIPKYERDVRAYSIEEFQKVWHSLEQDVKQRQFREDNLRHRYD